MSTVKFVINRRHGEFGVSEEAQAWLSTQGMSAGEIERLSWGDLTIRAHPKLVEMVENLGERAWDQWSKLKVTHIPTELFENHCFDVSDYEGKERIKLLPERLVIKRLMAGATQDELISIVERYKEQMCWIQ